MDSDIRFSLDLINLFGKAFVLRTNVQKSSVFPIKCTDMDIATVQDHLLYELLYFPYKYLGIPLFQKITKGSSQTLH